jgi:hypothetical protein
MEPNAKISGIILESWSLLLNKMSHTILRVHLWKSENIVLFCVTKLIT